MARPFVPRAPSEHLVTLSRMRRQVEIDENLPVRRRRRIENKLAELMAEFQKELGEGGWKAKNSEVSD